VTASLPKKSRDARQVSGLVALGIIGALVVIALGATIVSGLNGDWASGFDTVRRVTWFTLWQAILSLALSLAIAIPVALALDNQPKFAGRRMVLLLFTIPLALPVIVAVMALLALLGRNGMLSQLAQGLGLGWKPDIYGLSGILIAHVFFNMPLAARMILQGFEAIAQNQWKLAESLRFNAWDRFVLLQWPVLKEILPGIASLIFLLCLGSYTIILVLGGGPHTTTLQVAIYQALSFDFDIARAALLTLVQLGLTLALLLALPHAPASHIQGAMHGARRYHQVTRVQRVSSALLISVGAMFVALPLVAILVSGLVANHAALLRQPLLWQALGTSLVIGLLSAALALCAAWALCSAAYAYRSAQSSLAARLVGSVPLAMLAIPSLVLGVGWFLFALKTGLPLKIAPLFIVAANAMMALPFTMQILQPKLHEHFSTNDRLTLSLGLTGTTRLKLIDLPVMRRPLMTAGLFAFALSLGDLGVITLFGSDQILTLPGLIYQKMGSYRTNDAAGLALYLALLTGIATFLALKAQHHEHV
jgi:thiamine transport system permease protein